MREVTFEIGTDPTTTLKVAVERERVSSSQSSWAGERSWVGVREDSRSRTITSSVWPKCKTWFILSGPACLRGTASVRASMAASRRTEGPVRDRVKLRELETMVSSTSPSPNARTIGVDDVRSASPEVSKASCKRDLKVRGTCERMREEGEGKR